MKKEFKFPSGIEFLSSGDGYVVKYIKDKKLKSELDIWGIAYALSNKRDNDDYDIEINIVLPSDFTEQDKCSLYLRHYFLKDVLSNVKISIDGGREYIKKAEEIISWIQGGEYITYSNDKKGPKFESRGTKNKLESQVEEMITLNNSAESPFGVFQEKKRQWPANIFKKTISTDSRKTRRRWIDMVAVDGKNRLSALEIKSGDNLPLDLFVQNFDYMIYLHLFKGQILKDFFETKTVAKQIAGYFIVEKMHPLLTEIIFKYLKNSDIFNFEEIRYSCIRNDDALEGLKIEFTSTIGSTAPA